METLKHPYVKFKQFFEYSINHLIIINLRKFFINE